MVPYNYVVLDLETTGVDPTADEIIEIGALKVEAGQIIDTWHSLVLPSRPIPSFITELTGISNETVAGAPGLKEIFQSLRSFLGDLPILGHNVRFDAGFVEAAQGYTLPNVLLDSAEAARVIFPLMPAYRLEKLAQLLELATPPTHRALDDARTTYHLWEKLWREAAGWDVYYTLAMAKFAAQVKWNYSNLLEAVLDTSVKSFPRSKKRGGPVWLAPDKSTVTSLMGCELNKDEQKTTELKPGPDGFETFFSSEGPVAGLVADYDYRPQQVAMAQAVWEAFSEEKFLLMEAGTGTGKSLAYLLPALMWAKNNDEKVVLATNTINLQEQLWYKDIPLLQQAVALPFAAALVKGRSNYICLNRWEQKITHGHGLEQNPDFWMKIWRWLSLTETGDVSEINLTPTTQALWGDTAATAETCLGSACPWHNNRCFLQRARRAAEKADLLVVNHSLLLADVQTDNRVLPSYHYLVVDEAHHLEDVATEQMGRQVQNTHLYRWLSNLERFLRQFLKNKDLQATGGFLEENLKSARELMPLIKEKCEALFTALAEWARATGLGENEQYRLQVRLTAEKLDRPGWHAVRVAADNLLLNLGLLQDKLKAALELWGSGEKAGERGRELEGEGEERSKELLFLAGEGEGMLDNLTFLLDVADDNYVYWMEWTEENKEFLLRAAPLKVGALLSERLFEKKKSIVFTSATLAVGGQFEHFSESIGLAGLPSGRIMSLAAESPFCYDSQVLLCVPQDLPNPYQNQEASFTAEVAGFLEGLIEVTGGRTLVLFTSHKMLQAVYRRLKPALISRGITLLAHGIDGGRARLVETLKKGGNTVVLGASSFWEGVDIPGDNLSCVVVVKIPFVPPTIPTVEARLEALDRENKDSFRFFSLPQAILKIKQGFGRLVRSKSDRGVVIILDKRVTSRNYGQAILKSLPVSTYVKGDSRLVFQKIKNWLAEKTVEVQEKAKT